MVLDYCCHGLVLSLDVFAKKERLLFDKSPTSTSVENAIGKEEHRTFSASNPCGKRHQR